MPAELPPLVDRGLRLARVDFAPGHRQPSGPRVVAALALSVAGSLAIAVTLVLWMPDLYILYQGESASAVAVLIVMHVAIALVTYNCLVRIAPVGASRGSAGSHARTPASDSDRFARRGS